MEQINDSEVVKPRKTRRKSGHIDLPEGLTREALEAMTKQLKTPADVHALLANLNKAVLERMLQEEMQAHLGGRESGQKADEGETNRRNGTSSKTLRGELGNTTIDIPRDREATFKPIIIEKHQRDIGPMEEKILSLYAKGMSCRDVQETIAELYKIEVSTEFISSVTDAVLEEVKRFQSRPLERIYPVVYLDALYISVRENGHVQKKAFYLALGITVEGRKEVLGIWTSKNEGAKFWLHVLTEMKNRGVEDILIACVDGLSGFPEAIEAAFPRTSIQQCVVHLVRNSLKYVSHIHWEEVCRDLKAVYLAPTVAEAETFLSAFEDKWTAYPMVARLWRNAWERVTVCFAFPMPVRRMLYTTNAIESLNAVLRRAMKNRSSFPSEEAAMKVLYLALERHSKSWVYSIKEWSTARNHFEIFFEGRMND
jgi:putative transposase